MKLTVNGREIDFDGTMLSELVAKYKLQPEMIVAERNGEIVNRDTYSEQELFEGDVVELVRFVGGGQRS